MFIRRRLNLDPQGPSLAEPLLRREYFSDVALAGEYLSRAQAEAEHIRAQAHAEGEQWLAQAQAEFYQRAEALLSDWEAERQAQAAALVDQAQSLLKQTLTTLLGEFSQAQRAEALVRQIAQSQSRPVQATLRCAVDLHAPVEHWLQGNPHAHWQLECDTSLAPGTLCLSSPSGDFSLDWQHLCERLGELA